MSKSRYGWAHRQERARWAPIVEAGGAHCAEPICVMSTRWIPPGSAWHLCHDPSGMRYIGVGHERCNVTEAATRMHVMRRPVLKPWTL